MTTTRDSLDIILRVTRLPNGVLAAAAHDAHPELDNPPARDPAGLAAQVHDLVRRARAALDFPPPDDAPAPLALTPALDVPRATADLAGNAGQDDRRRALRLHAIERAVEGLVWLCLEGRRDVIQAVGTISAVDTAARGVVADILQAAEAREP